MVDSVVSIAMEEHFPAGFMGPEPTVLDIRAFLVPYGSGLVLVDTGMDQSGKAIDAALSEVGAAWSDVSHILVSHGHPDHTGALQHVRTSAPDASVFAGPTEGVEGAQPLTDGMVVGGLRVFATPGHTPGHVSLVEESTGVLLVGDCLGVVDGQLARAPERFTSDAAQAERSLHRLRDLRGARMLFCHGPEIDDPWTALDELLDES